MVRHMLLVGGSRDIHPKAKQLGLKLSLLIPMPKLKALQNLDIYARVIGLPSIAPVEEWVDAARLIERLDPIDTVGGFNEETQDYAAIIACVLELPFHAPDVIRYTRHKDEMQQVLREAGLDTTPSSLVTSQV